MASACTIPAFLFSPLFLMFLWLDGTPGASFFSYVLYYLQELQAFGLKSATAPSKTQHVTTPTKSIAKSDRLFVKNSTISSKICTSSVGGYVALSGPCALPSLSCLLLPSPPPSSHRSCARYGSAIVVAAVSCLPLLSLPPGRGTVEKQGLLHM